MHILLIFLDGIGLGVDDAESNPFAVAEMPTITELTNGHRWVKDISMQVSERALFIPTDPRMGVEGRPQSGTGQATILTGLNVPKMIGRHYGPKPDAETRQIITEHSFFKRVVEQGMQSALLTAYPPGLIHNFERGKTLRSSIQQAAYESGRPHFSTDDLIAQRALTAEWTGKPWHTYLKITDIPIWTPYEAGKLLVELSRDYDFAMHSHWFTDRVGHRGPFKQGVGLLEMFDELMRGVLDTWQDDEGLVLVTSDHGNMEDLSHGKHTKNNVPTLIIGKEKEAFAEGFGALTDFVPRMEKLLFIP